MDDKKPKDERVFAEVGEIQVIPHSRGPCRHCGEPFEQKGGHFGCGCSGATACPHCGVAVRAPLNGETSR